MSFDEEHANRSNLRPPGLEEGPIAPEYGRSEESLTFYESMRLRRVGRGPSIHFVGVPTERGASIRIRSIANAVS